MHYHELPILEQRMARESPLLAQIIELSVVQHITQVVPLKIASIFGLRSSLSCVKVKDSLMCLSRSIASD